MTFYFRPMKQTKRNKINVSFNFLLFVIFFLELFFANPLLSQSVTDTGKVPQTLGSDNSNKTTQQNTQGTQDIKDSDKNTEFIYELPQIFQESKNKPSSGEIFLESADSGEFVRIKYQENGILELFGRVKLRLGKRYLISDHIRVNMDTREIFAPGKVRLVDGEKYIEGKNFYYDQNKGRAIFYKTIAYLRPFHMKGERLRRVNEEVSIFDKGNITTCDLENPHYFFEAQKIWIYGDRKLFALDVWIHVGNSRIFYLPFLYQTSEGSGIITQFGYSARRGAFLQNTLNLSFRVPQVKSGKFLLEDEPLGDELNGKINRNYSDLSTRWMIDFYQRIGQYFSMQFDLKENNIEWFNRIGYARHYPVDYDTELGRFRNLTDTNAYRDSQNRDVIAGGDGVLSESDRIDLSAQNWFSINSKLDFDFLEDPLGKHNLSYEITWRSHAYMFPFFEKRRTPSSTLDMLSALVVPESYSTPVYQQNWYAGYSHKGNNSSLLVFMQRKWQWDQSKTFLDPDAGYFPKEESLPGLKYRYSNLFEIADDLAFNYGTRLNYQDIKLYDSYGSLVNDYYTSDGNIYLALPFSLLWNYLSLQPKISYGYYKQASVDPTDAQREQNQRASFQYYETVLASRIGSGEYYLNTDFKMLRAFKEERSEEPFYNDRVRRLDWVLYLAPLEDFYIMTKTGYDLRDGYERDADRWDDIKVSAHWIINFLNFNDKGRIDFYKKYRLAFYRLHIINNYNYITRIGKHGTNDVNVKYEFGNIFSSFFDQIHLMSIGLRWLHDFNNIYQDRIFLTWEVDIEFLRFWHLQAGGNSILEQVYRYQEDVSPLNDILNSYNIFNETKRQNSLFRMNDIYVNLRHDLHCWEMMIGWAMQHNLTPFGVNLNHRLSYYEQIFYIEFKSKDLSGVGIPKSEIFRQKPDPDDYNG